MSRPIGKARLLAIAQEVRTLHDKDEALSKVRLKSKVEQRDVRLRIGELVNQVTEAQLPVIAQQSGYTVARLKNFAFVRTQWPNGSFPADVSFTPLEELVRDEDRFTLIASGMSKRDARAARGGKVDTPSRWSPAVKADFIAEAVSDPEVAAALAANPEARAAMAEAEWQRREDARRINDLTNPGFKAQRERTELQELVRDIDNLRYRVGRAVDQAMELEAAGDPHLVETVAELKNAVGWLDSYTNGGDTAFESDLTRLLEG